MKSLEAALSFILEDFVEVGLQYFYFEKYGFMPDDVLVYFNAVFMIIKALVFTYQIFIAMKDNWHDEDSFRFSLLEAFFKYNLALNSFRLQFPS